MVYHLFSLPNKTSLVLKVMLPRWKDDKPGELPEVPSVSGVWSTADWHEREVYDLSGVYFTGHPDLRRILCPEDWVGHPLRKDYEMPLEYHGIRGRIAATSMSHLDDPRIIEFDVRTDEMLVNMGPQHPSTHGVLRLVLRTDGEVVSEVTPHIGYLHRCAEKIGENLTPRQWIPYTDRMDYLAGMNMNLGWALAVEKLMKLELARKGPSPAVIIAELNRIASHLVGMGAYGLDLGTFSPFLVRLPRAGKDSRPVRGSLRRPADLQLPHGRRRHGRPAAGLAAKVRGVSRTSSSR